MPKPSRDTGIRISVEGDMVDIRGPMKILRKVLPLPLLFYVESDGEVEVAMHDPIESAGNVRANTVIHRMRDLTGIPEFAEWMHTREAH